MVLSFFILILLQNKQKYEKVQIFVEKYTKKCNNIMGLI